MRCSICQSEAALFIKDIFDDRYGYPELFDIYECTACKSFQTEPPFDPAKIGDLYTRFYPRQNITAEDVQKRAGKWQQESAFRQWLSGEHRIHHRLKPGQLKILDVGCGDGSSLLELKKLGYDAHGIEADTNLAKVKDKLGLDIHIGTIENARFASGSFDMIIANQVVEHVTNLDSFISHIEKMLKQDKLKKDKNAPGKVILSTPNAKSIFRMIYGRKWIHWHIPYHQQILSGQALQKVLEKYGFTVTKIQTVSPTSWAVHEINRLRFDAKLGVKNPFWVGGEVTSSLAGKTVRKLALFAMCSLGKIADVFKHGNCLIIYAEKSDKPAA